MKGMPRQTDQAKRWTPSRGIPARLARLFAALREMDKNNTQTYLAEVMGIGKSNPSNWTRHNDPDVPGLLPLVLLCEKFNLTLDYIIWGEAKSQMDSDVMAIIHRLEKKKPAAALSRPDPSKKEH